MLWSCLSGLQNDHKDIMVEIEEALHKLHAREKTKRQQDETGAQDEAMEQQVTLPPPFARVDAVTQGSPACGAVSDVNYIFVSDRCLKCFCSCDYSFWLSFFPKGAESW